MFFIRLKVFILSAILLSIFMIFVLYLADLYIKNDYVSSISAQLNNATKQAFESVNQSSSYIHNYSIIKSMEQQKFISNTWISSSSLMGENFRKDKQPLRDIIEKQVYVSKQQEASRTAISNNEIFGIIGTSDEVVRISSPVIVKQSCLSCHSGVRVGEAIGSTNISLKLYDNIMPITEVMREKLIIAIVIISLLFTTSIMISTGIFTKIIFSIKTAMQHSLEGNFSYRVKRQGFGLFNEAILVTNKLLDVLDKGISAIDTRIGTIFIYKKSLYSKNPLKRIIELVTELTVLFGFKAKLEGIKNTKDAYKELQNAISKYIKFQSLIFVEILNGEITSGHKTENNSDSKITINDAKNIEERLKFENRNVLFDDKNGCIFVSTSNKQENVIDIKVNITNKIVIYYSLFMANKKDLIEKENSVTRVYNYIREFRPLINNLLLLKSIEEASYTDQLTKTYNRLYLEKYIKQIEEKLNNGTGFGVLMLDIDHFKKVNDTYGHSVGDAGIVMLTESIMKVIRPVDKIFRYGGEEFVVFLEGADIDDSYLVAERIREVFQKETKCSLMELTFSKSASIGISAMPIYSNNAWECINQADIALYEAKRSGRNRVIRYYPGLQKNNSAPSNNPQENGNSSFEEKQVNI